MNEVLRQERKFVLTLDDYYHIADKLSNVMLEDKHNGIDGYKVRSLYFDTLDDRDFEEKEDGIELRRKIRLRIYDSESEFALLEMKQKQGNNQKKRSLRMKREDAKQLILGNYTVLLDYQEAFASECFAYMSMHLYRPKSVVEYQRKAYIAKENNIRITFDHNIVANEGNFDIFSKHLPLYPVLDTSNMILEVKYNHFLLSYVKDLVNAANKSELSISKYALARSVSKHYHQ